MSHLEQTRAAWETQAESYDRVFTPLLSQVARRALILAGVRPGMRLVDIASGGGAVSLPAAELGADVLAVDYAQAMVDLLSQRAATLGLANLQVQMMDGTALALDDDSFDIAVSQLGIMLFPDRAAGLSEMARITKPGGKGVMVVFGPPARVQPLSLFFEALRQTAPDFKPPSQSPLFSLQDQDLLREEMLSAGLEDVAVDRFEVILETVSGDALWSTVIAGAPAITGLMRTVPEDQQAEARRWLNDAVRERMEGSETAKLPMAFNIAVGATAAPAEA